MTGAAKPGYMKELDTIRNASMSLHKLHIDCLSVDKPDLHEVAGMLWALSDQVDISLREIQSSHNVSEDVQVATSRLNDHFQDTKVCLLRNVPGITRLHMQATQDS